MNIELTEAVWPARQCAVFFRSRDRFGNLSNMTGSFPLTTNGLKFQSSEGLYQALKYPGSPAFQREIAQERSGMDAKKTAYRRRDFRPDWDGVKLDAMALCLALKLLQHPDRFGHALKETGNMPIVERSNRDPWWGAMPHGADLKGINALGRLLTELRDIFAAEDHAPQAAAERFLTQVDLSRLTVTGQTLANFPASQTRNTIGQHPTNP